MEFLGYNIVGDYVFSLYSMNRVQNGCQKTVQDFTFLKIKNMDNKFTRWNDKIHHPNERCESTVKSGQCPFLKIQGTNKCVMHGANKTSLVHKNEVKRNYQLKRWQQRVAELADSDTIKSLREEIGILRMVMEEILNKCDDSFDLLMNSQRISDVAMKIEKLVVSCDKLEGRMGQLISKRAIIQLASDYVRVINNHIQDPETIEAISVELLEATEKSHEYVD